MILFPSIIKLFEAEFLHQYREKILPSHYKALGKLKLSTIHGLHCIQTPVYQSTMAGTAIKQYGLLAVINADDFLGALSCYHSVAFGFIISRAVFSVLIGAGLVDTRLVN